MSMVCLDTQVLTWAMQQISGRLVDPKYRPVLSAQEDDLRTRAASLVESLASEKTPIGLPSVVVAEFLCVIPEDKHQAALNLLAQTFMILPMDAPAAVTFAALYRERKASLVAAKAQNDDGPTRAEMKADLMIVATAVTAKAAAIYSHDPHLKTFARGRIAVMELPPRQATQLSLPVEDKPAASPRVAT